MNKNNEIIIIGGGHIFHETSESMNKLIITRVDCDIDGDIYTAGIGISPWQVFAIDIAAFTGDSDTIGAALQLNLKI